MFSSIHSACTPGKPPPASQHICPSPAPASTTTTTTPVSASATGMNPAITSSTTPVTITDATASPIRPPSAMLSGPPPQLHLAIPAQAAPSDAPDSPSYFTQRPIPPSSASAVSSSALSRDSSTADRPVATTPSSVPAMPSVASVASSSYSFMTQNPPLMTASFPLRGPPTAAMVAAAAAAASGVSAASISLALPASTPFSSALADPAQQQPPAAVSAPLSPSVTRASTLPLQSSTTYMSFPDPGSHLPSSTTSSSHNVSHLPQPQQYPLGTYGIPPPPSTPAAIPPLSHHKFRSPSLPANSLLDHHTDIAMSLNPLSYTALQGLLQNDPPTNPTPAPKTLIVDVRPYTQYTKSRIKSAINICIPSTLLKRSTFPLSRFGECMMPSQRGCIDNLSSYSAIVIYDQSTEKVSTTIYSPIVYTILKFSQASSLKGKIYYLHGGISLVQESYPDLIETNVVEFGENAQTPRSPNTLSLASSSLPDASAKSNSADGNATLKTSTSQAFNFPPVLTGFSLPLNSIKDGPIKPFASNINGGRTIDNLDYDISPLKLPSDLTTAEIDSYFPPWLRDVIQSDSGPQKIARRFHHIEEAEKVRLQTAFSQGVRRNSESSPPSAVQSLTVPCTDPGCITTPSSTTSSHKTEPKEDTQRVPLIVAPSINSSNHTLPTQHVQLYHHHHHHHHPSLRSTGVNGSDITDDFCEPVTPDDMQAKYSFSAGVELGAKNRYSNIWPYDHTRVRLPEVLLEDSTSPSKTQQQHQIQHSKHHNDINDSNENGHAQALNDNNEKPNRSNSINTNSKHPAYLTIPSQLHPPPAYKQSLKMIEEVKEKNSQLSPTFNNNNAGSDYFNASYISPNGSRNRYIATQGPLPDTFADFWHVVWDKKIPLIIMLTAEVEGGQIKCHKYWEDGVYGSRNVEAGNGGQLTLTLMSTHQERLSKKTGNSVTIRRFKLVHGSESPVDKATASANSHTVIQIQYSSWPDLGSPTTPEDLIEICSLKDRYLKELIGPTSNTLAPSLSSDAPLPWVLVHCSAGCGRTGTFCTVDSVIDILREYGISSLPKRQLRVLRAPSSGTTASSNSTATNSATTPASAVSLLSQSSGEFVGAPCQCSASSPGDGSPVASTFSATSSNLNFESYDLVYRTVHDFRRQRLSMVQVLRQYVLCYETIITWIHQQHLRETGKLPQQQDLGPSLGSPISLTPHKALGDDGGPKTAIGTTSMADSNDLSAGIDKATKARRHYSTPTLVVSPVVVGGSENSGRPSSASSSLKTPGPRSGSESRPGSAGSSFGRRQTGSPLQLSTLSLRSPVVIDMAAPSTPLQPPPAPTSQQTFNSLEALSLPVSPGSAGSQLE